jgi:hypothetical protein
MFVVYSSDARVAEAGHLASEAAFKEQDAFCSEECLWQKEQQWHRHSQ